MHEFAVWGESVSSILGQVITPMTSPEHREGPRRHGAGMAAISHRGHRHRPHQLNRSRPRPAAAWASGPPSASWPGTASPLHAGPGHGGAHLPQRGGRRPGARTSSPGMTADRSGMGRWERLRKPTWTISARTGEGKASPSSDPLRRQPEHEDVNAAMKRSLDAMKECGRTACGGIRAHRHQLLARR